MVSTNEKVDEAMNTHNDYHSYIIKLQLRPNKNGHNRLCALVAVTFITSQTYVANCTRLNYAILATE